MDERQRMLTFDEETGRRLEAMYTTPDVAERYRITVEAAAPAAGERGLDIGPGPGILASELVERVAPDGRIAAIDTNPEMLAMTRHRAEHRGLIDRMDLLEADAASLPFDDATFDFIVAIQIYEYVSDIEQALAEAARVLRPGGRLAIVDTDWDTFVLQSDDAPLATRVVRAWDEHLVHRTLPRLLPGLLRRAGLELDAARPIAVVDTTYATSDFAAGLIDLIATFARGRAGLTDADIDAWLLDVRSQADRGSFFFSINQYCFRALAADRTG